MNDFDHLVEMFNRAGVAFTYDKDARVLTIQSDGSRKGPLRGYLSFYSEFAFDEHGTLTSVGIWE